MSRLIDADSLWMNIINIMDYCDDILGIVERQPTVEPEQTHNIMDFVGYQVAWLESHNDIELEPELEKLMVRMLYDTAECYIKEHPELEIIHCKDCKFYNPMNRETKTGICNLIMHQNFGDNWFCAGAERRTDD